MGTASIQLGFTEDGEPVTWNFSSSESLIIQGLTSSGKTSALALVAAKIVKQLSGELVIYTPYNSEAQLFFFEKAEGRMYAGGTAGILDAFTADVVATARLREKAIELEDAHSYRDLQFHGSHPIFALVDLDYWGTRDDHIYFLKDILKEGDRLGIYFIHTAHARDGGDLKPKEPILTGGVFRSLLRVHSCSWNGGRAECWASYGLSEAETIDFTLS